MLASVSLNNRTMCSQASSTSAETPQKIALILGNQHFRQDYGIKYAYLTGAMYRGIASKELVVRMGKAGLMGYLGTAGFSLEIIEENIQFIQKQLDKDNSYGMNLLSNVVEPEVEMLTVDLFLKYGICFVEAAAFMQITPALVKYRLLGLKKGPDQNIQCQHKVLAKVSRPEVAAAFMAPAPEKIVQSLLEAGSVTAEQAEWAKAVPMSHDICVEADSGGHTDMGVPTVLLPAMMSLRKEMQAKFNYKSPIRIGLAGGIGTPEAAAAAFVMGADFILTGSINQCTVESGTSDTVKDMLQGINVQDTDYAPAGDMFELGAKVQVLRKGVFFPARARKLYELYTQYNSLDEIPEKMQRQIQQRYFKKSFDKIWQEAVTYLKRKGRNDEIQRAEMSPKHKMARVFRWYFFHTNELAFEGDEANRVDFQVHTGPALGAFNQWVRGTDLESWRNRHVDEIAEKLMLATAKLLMEQTQSLVN